MVTGVGPGWVRVGTDEYRTSPVLLPDAIVTPWAAASRRWPPRTSSACGSSRRRSCCSVRACGSAFRTCVSTNR
ncbi:MAG: hypothetical protein MZW92_70575 [Comamonadaceae bacterium]|nr:hypothetical protein [Comamonadaceae bacterium]